MPESGAATSEAAKGAAGPKTYDRRRVSGKTALQALRREASDSEQLVTEYAKVLAHAVETFGSRTNANAWLDRPNRVFNNRSPLQILTQDPGAVEEELVRIDHGMFV